MVEYRAGCVRVVVLALLGKGLREELKEKLKNLGLVVLDVGGFASYPLRLSEVLDWVVEKASARFGRPVSPDEILVVVDLPVYDHDVVTREYGLVKLLNVSGCSVDEILETVKAVACLGGVARCLVDAGLGWLQA